MLPQRDANGMAPQAASLTVGAFAAQVSTRPAEPPTLRRRGTRSKPHAHTFTHDREPDPLAPTATAVSSGQGGVHRHAGGAARPPARLRHGRGRLPAVVARRRRDHRRARARGARRHRLGALLLHGQHAHGDGPRPRHRLRALHRLALPGGAGAGSRYGRCDRDAGRDREPCRPLQRQRLRARHGRPPARAEHDHAEPCRRRHRRSDRLRGGGA